ncbi:DUF362 domain-containing protein [Candidatus Bathyarchaeota archaeon]|nr:DUF362 domain-containing protein [Candidatus Bathyarchaeota archaeon]
MSSDKSDIFRITDCPIPAGSMNHHEGLDALLRLMGSRGLKLLRTRKETDIGGEDGLIDKSDIVLIKVNAQWKYRGCTNSDVVKGLIQRILEHPDGFDGEIVLFENGQGRGSLHCSTTMVGLYPDAEVHANAEEESHSFSYLVDKVFADTRVSMFLLDPIRNKFISKENHSTDGYRKLSDISYPCFTTSKGNRIELEEGVWNGKGYDKNLKLITIPVLKDHGDCGVTGALKIFYGVLSMSYRYDERHYRGLGRVCGEMISEVRAPVITILDCIWVSQGATAGYPLEKTTRLNQLLASVDPVALDYWASKYLLYPIDKNEEHHPDKFAILQRHLTQARDVINSAGGINGHKVTFEESEINVLSSRCSNIEQLISF